MEPVTRPWGARVYVPRPPWMPEMPQGPHQVDAPFHSGVAQSTRGSLRCQNGVIESILRVTG